LSYLVFLWLPLGQVVLESNNTGNFSSSSSSSATNQSPWYLYLSARVALHGVVYLLVGGVGLYIFQRHKASQQHGYLRFYRSINFLRRLPIFTMSIINVTLLPLWTFTALKVLSVQRANDLLRGLIILESIIVLPCFFLYVIRVQRHNKSKPLPDAQQVMSSSFEPSVGNGDGGIGGGSRGGDNRYNGNLDNGRDARMDGVASTWSGDGGNPSTSTPELRRYQADMVKWQNLKIKDLQHQVLSLVERNQQLEKKQLVLARQQLLQQAQGSGSGGGGSGNMAQRQQYQHQQNPSAQEDDLRRRLEESTREQTRLSSLLREEKRKIKRKDNELRVEREMNLESQRIIESMHKGTTDDGHTSTSS